MGYVPAERESAQDKILIAFEEGHDLYGAELECWRDPGLDLALDVLAFLRKDSVAPTEFRAIVRRFGDGALISWNILDRQHSPMPANGAGLLKQDRSFIRQVMTAWIVEAVTPSAPLVATSADGSTSEAA